MRLIGTAGSATMFHGECYDPAILARSEKAHEIKTASDQFLIVLARPSDAVKFSLLLQAELHSPAKHTGQSLLVRIGIHVGEVWIQHNEKPGKSRDLYGTALDVCARVKSLGDALRFKWPSISSMQRKSKHKVASSPPVRVIENRVS